MDVDKPEFNTPPVYAKKASASRAAWSDPADEPIQVSVNIGRARKLRDAPDETGLSGREYESRLRRQYERINPQPEWARKKYKRARSTSSATDEEDQKDLINSTSRILEQKSSTTLQKGTLAIERLRDANQSTQSTDAGAVRALTFHPSDQVPLLCVASADRRARLFNVSHDCWFMVYLTTIRSTGTQTRYYKHSTFPPYPSPPLHSIQQARSSC